MIKKIVSGALVAATLGAAAIAGPASAQPRGDWHGGAQWRGDGYRGRDGAAVVGAGILGLALGAAIASPHPYYAPRPAYYAGSYGYACAPHWRWDRYVGRYVWARDCY